MQQLYDVLNKPDLVHWRTILGLAEDPAQSETKRRIRVNQIASTHTAIADQALKPFRALSQNERERLLSDIVWQVTCFVEGSITKAKGKKGIPLEYGFKLVRLEEGDRTTFCVVKHD